MSTEATLSGVDGPTGKLRIRKALTRVRQKSTDVPAKYFLLHTRLLDAHDNPALQAYISGRWLDAVSGARESMKRDQREFRRMNLAALGAAAVSPVLVAATAAADGSVHVVLTVAAIVTSLTAAITSVLLQTARPGIKWQLHRTLRDQLEATAWAHLATLAANPLETSAGQASWCRFVASVEKAIGEHNSIYTDEVAGVLGTRPATASPTVEDA